MSENIDALIEVMADKAIEVGTHRERLRILKELSANPKRYATLEAVIDLVNGLENV